jgi:hypothetical protein
MKQDCSSSHRNSSCRLSWLAGTFLQVFGKKPKKQTESQIHRQDFTANTQRMGMRFTERLRDVFRNGWLRLK